MSESTRHCYDFEGVERFSAAALDYAQARPSYPLEAIAHILAQSPHGRPSVIVDVGAGTAIGTRLLAQQAGLAIALEPNPDMIAAAQKPEGVVWVRGHAETLPLRTASVDLLTAFNSFHWFKPEAFLSEARRVLAAEGRLVLVWNDWDDRDPFTAAFVKLMRGEAGDFPPEDREAEVAPLYATPHFGGVERSAHPFRHRLDEDDLVARMRSVSYVPKTGPRWDAVERALRALFDRHADSTGCVTHHYTTHVFLAT
jgi:SAM-dependent methyltransferase